MKKIYSETKQSLYLIANEYSFYIEIMCLVSSDNRQFLVKIAIYVLLKMRGRGRGKQFVFFKVNLTRVLKVYLIKKKRKKK